MSDDTPRLKLAQLVSLQELNAVTWNEALAQLDALVDLTLLGQFANTPPASPQDGDAYLIGGAPTGAWSGYAYKIASCLDGVWRFYTPFNGLRAYVTTTGAFIVYLNGTWTDWNALISANEVAIASAATCDLGAAGSLFVQITGTTTIASFGNSANKLRYVRFAQSLTLTHNATSLILLGAANRITAAGDVALYASDASGNWRERGYFRAAANAGDFATKSGSEMLANKTFSGGTAFPGGTNIDGNGKLGVLGTSPTGDSLAVYSDGAYTGSATLLLQNRGTGGNDYTVLFLRQSDTAAIGMWGLGGQNAGNAGLRNTMYIGTQTSNPFKIVTNDTARWMVDGTVGSLMPVFDNSVAFGGGSNRPTQLYAMTATINTSGAAAKTNLRPLSEVELAVAKALAGNVYVGQYLDAVTQKGEALARLHIFTVAETVFDIFTAHGLDPFRYGICCRDPAVKKVTRSVTELRQKTRSVARQRETVTVAGGVATLSFAEIEEEEGVFEELPLRDTAGAPVLDAAGRPRSMRVAVTEEITRTVVEQVPDLNDDGTPKYNLGLRNTELLMFLAAGQNVIVADLQRRLTALETV